MLKRRNREKTGGKKRKSICFWMFLHRWNVQIIRFPFRTNLSYKKPLNEVKILWRMLQIEMSLAPYAKRTKIIILTWQYANHNLKDPLKCKIMKINPKLHEQIYFLFHIFRRCGHFSLPFFCTDLKHSHKMQAETL